MFRIKYSKTKLITFQSICNTDTCIIKSSDTNTNTPQKRGKCGKKENTNSSVFDPILDVYINLLLKSSCTTSLAVSFTLTLLITAVITTIISSLVTLLLTNLRDSCIMKVNEINLLSNHHHLYMRSLVHLL